MEVRYNPEKTLKKWEHIQSTQFSKWVNTNFAYDLKSEDNLFIQQRFVRDYLQEKSPYRGLLLYHGLGVGKTAASIVASDSFLNRGVCVMLPASLRQNFIYEIQKYGNRMFSTNQNWTFMKKDNVSEKTLALYRLEKAKYLMYTKSGEKNIGLWIPNKNEPSNYETLSSINKKYIDKQLNDMIKSAYNFIHYNGINKKKLIDMTENNTINPFDNKFIIIDEVHNFISRVVNKSKIATTVYNLLMDANNCKILLLSGTPLINYPHELAYLHNIVRGKVNYHSLFYSKKTNVDLTSLTDYFEKSPYVQEFVLQEGIITFITSENGFKFDSKKEYLKKDDTTDNVIDKIISDVEKLGIKFSKKKHAISESKVLLPTESIEFNSSFIDFAETDIVNIDMLSRRLQGLISYYHAYPADLYPLSSPLKIVKVPMSEHQFVKYGIERDKETKFEMKMRMMGKINNQENIFENKGNTYRCFSRSICNFVFPQDIIRPYPSTINDFKKEMDDIDDIIENDDNEDENIKDTFVDYSMLLEKTMNKLKYNAKKYLTLDNIAMYSPKFKHLIENINECPGTCLVYSQFRTVEGLGVLSLALNVNGYDEFKIIKNDKNEWDINDIDVNKQYYALFNSDPEYIQILLNIFNSNFDQLPKTIYKKIKHLSNDKNLHGKVIKILMITQSGSEGISLKNVRQVHILEPYWNNIRVNQVIGRAVRANSHIDLPLNERHVESFLYLSVFNELQDMKHDKNMTSDEYIYDIAIKKANIMNKLLNVMKDTSVDCQLHNKVHENTKCFVLHNNFRNEKYAYVMDMKLDKPDNVLKNAKKKVTYEDIKLTIIKFKDGNRFALDKSTGILYDVEKANNNEMEVVGKIKKVDGILTYKLNKK
jgi:hypothetical protein